MVRARNTSRELLEPELMSAPNPLKQAGMAAAADSC